MPTRLARGAGATLAVVVVLAVLTQTLGTCYLAQAFGLLYRLEHDSEDPYQHAHDAIDDIQLALTLVPLPDPVGYAGLTQAYQASTFYYSQEHPKAGLEDATLTSLHDKMYATGERTLRILDREAQVQRLLLRATTTEPARYPEGERVAMHLIAHEPRSSEVRLLYARLLEKEGKMDQALASVGEAVKLDDSNPNIYTFRAHLQLTKHQQEFVQDPAPWQNPLLIQIAADYQRSLDGLGAARG